MSHYHAFIFAASLDSLCTEHLEPARLVSVLASLYARVGECINGERT